MKISTKLRNIRVIKYPHACISIFDKRLGCRSAQPPQNANGVGVGNIVPSPRWELSLGAVCDWSARKAHTANDKKHSRRPIHVRQRRHFLGRALVPDTPVVHWGHGALDRHALLLASNTQRSPPPKKSSPTRAWNKYRMFRPIQFRSVQQLC